MQKAVVLEAAAAEEGVEGVQGLLPLHRLGARPVDVGGALWWQHVGVGHLRELPVPGDKHKHPGMCFPQLGQLYSTIRLWPRY